MIKVVSGRAEIRGRVTFPHPDNLTGFPGQSNSTDGAICWTIIKYDGVIECCSYPGEMLPVCLYISLWPPEEPSPPIGPTGEALGGTRAQRSSLHTNLSVGRAPVTSRSASVPASRAVSGSVTTPSGGSTGRIGGGSRNVSSHGVVVISTSR